MNPEIITTTRRIFLARGLTLIGAAATVPTFLERSAWAISPAEGAATRSRSGVPEDHVLVVLQLAGGNDGLNTVIPAGDDLYYKNRPRIGIEKSKALKLSDTFSLHPSLTGLQSLYDDGLLAIVHGVGYPNPNRSHFKSTDIWETASPDGRLHSGWMGRYFDHTCKGEDPPNPEHGVALRKDAPLSMRGDRFLPVAFERPESLTWNGVRRSGPGGARMAGFGKARVKGRRVPRPQPQGEAPLLDQFEELNQPGRSQASTIPELAYLQRTAMDARLSAADIQAAVAGRPAVPYPPSPLANSLRTVARMIGSKLPTRIYYVSQSGYDTHAAQAGRHQQLLTQLGDALKAFAADLKATGHLNRVTLMTFSEFGRRVAENASGGTDHGTAAPMFIVSPRIKPGFHGRPCSLDQLDRGDMAFTTDFRSIYAALLRDWMGADPGPILGRPFEPLPVFRASGT